MLNCINDTPNLLYHHKVTRANAVTLKPLQEGEKISILSDVMMKTMFQQEERLKYSCKFLSYFLDVSYEELLENIKLVKNELDKEYVKERVQYVDYVAKIKDTMIGIEVNNNSSVEVMERNLNYASRLYSWKSKENKKYSYHQVIQFNLNNFAFQENDKIIDRYVMQNDEGVWLNNKIIIIQIYIPNLRKKWYDLGIEGLSEGERYILSLVEPNIEIAKELGSGNIIVEEYIEESKKVIYGDIGESYDKEWALKDEGIREGREEGLKEGEKKGMQEASIRIAKNMLQNGETLDKIVNYTSLPLEVIEALNFQKDN